MGELAGQLVACSSSRSRSRSRSKSRTRAKYEETTRFCDTTSSFCRCAGNTKRIVRGQSKDHKKQLTAVLSESPGVRVTKTRSTLFCGAVLFAALFTAVSANEPHGFQDAVHITAILGESVVFNCHVEFPGDHPVPYVLQWEKKVGETGQEIPIYIWYESYPTHSGEGYEGRVSRVAHDSNYGAASLNLTNIQESDQGWYECKVVFLNRSPNSHKNGTWFHLDVHAPPRFSVTPEEIIYVNIGDAIILNCQAEGTPAPEILWYKDANPVEPSATVGIFNDGTELRISNIRAEDIGDYTCIARNGEGQVSHTARVIIAGGAVIMVPPTNQTKLEGEKAQFTCEAKALPGNVTVRWFREGSPVREVAALETRVSVKRDGSLIVNPVSADDSGQYLCEVTNGIGEPQSASAYLNVEYPAKVTFTPTVQYLPFRLAGVVQCYIKANPPLQYVTWTKDKRLLEPYQTKDIVIMNNGSLLFTRVNQNHQGRYTCTPYNAQGTQGSSGPMEVLVRKPPVFTLEPEPLYQRKVGESVEMHCDALEAEGTQRPNIQWQRRDGAPLQRARVRTSGGNITIEGLRRSDFGFYQCVAANEVATIVTATQLVVEGTQPHAPYNVSGTATEFSVTLSWLPGYSGGPDYKQDYTIWYREAGISDWTTMPVTPSGSTQVTINGLSPSTTYEFQVMGKNALGDGMSSKVMTIRTLDVGRAPKLPQPTPTPNEKIFQLAPDDAGPKPGPPRNLTVTEISNGFLITWQVPLERAHLIQFYTIKYRTDAQWKTLNKGQIRPEETSYLVKNLVGGRTYYFRVLANSPKSYESSDEVKFPVPARVKHKAITAGVVGGILFFIVAIILSVCAVKICNKRKRRKQEKAYNMVACRITDARNGQAALGVTTTGYGYGGGSVIGGQTAGGTLVTCLPSNTYQSAGGQVPLKKYIKSRIPGVNLLRAIKNWVWPSDSVLGVSSRPYHRDLSRIQRTPDGKFVLNGESDMEECDLDISSSDDGGFLPRVRSPSVHTVHPPAWTSPWYFSDISSVRPDASAQLRTVHARYSQELPSLRAMHQQALLLRPGFVPVHPLATSSPPRGITNNTIPRPKKSTMPLHIDPDSRSSSSGFGSKNTSGTSHHLLHPLPPYRPPPPAPLPPPPPNFISPWLELAASRLGVDHSGMKADSVDGHYEFDRATPATSTPTGEPITARKPRLSTTTASMRCDEIEARVQAMLQEFQAFRRRQAIRRAAALETVC